MSTRISSLCALTLLLAACDNRPDNEVLADAEARAEQGLADDGKIECAVNGETDFRRGCETERLSGEAGVTLIIRHPDGGFRRFNVLTDGRGLEAADGFEQAQIEIVEDGKIRVSVGADQYLLPAQVKSDTPQEMATETTEEEPVEAGN